MTSWKELFESFFGKAGTQQTPLVLNLLGKASGPPTGMLAAGGCREHMGSGRGFPSLPHSRA